MGDRALINQSYGGRQSLLDGEAIQASMGGSRPGVPMGTPTPTPVPAFLSQPSISPLSGSAQSTTFTAIPGTVSNGSVASRVWQLNGSVASTAQSFLPSASGTLTYQETATGPGGTVMSAVQTVSVSAAVSGTAGTVADVTQAKITGIGDSIMRGLAADYPALSKLGYPTSVTIENRGQDNLTIWQALYDAQAGSGWGSAAGSWDSAKTNVLLFQRVTNDLGKNNGISGDIAYADMAAYVRIAQNQGFYVAVETCLPRFAEWTSGKEAERIKYNNLVRQNAMGADLIIDSASDSVIGDSGDLSGKAFQTSYPGASTTYYADGVHLTTAGQDRKAIIYKNALPTLLTLAPRAKGQFPATVAAAAFTAQPTVSPTSGSTGQTFTATPGTISNGRVYSRNWLLNGSSISTGVTAVPNATGTLTYQEVPYGLGGGNGSASNVISVTVGSTPTPSPTPTPTPAPTPTPTPTSSGDPATSRTTAMTYGPGKFSQGRTAGTVLIPTSAVPASPTLPITFEIWAMLPTSATAEAWLMCTDRAPGNNNTWGLLCQSDGKMRLTASNMFDQSKQLSTTFVMRDGAWHHYRVRLYTASIEVDVDGVLTGQLAIAPVTGAQMVLGEIYQNQYGVGWTGSYDEFAAFSGARTGAAPTAAYVGNETNLLALYHLDGNLLSGKQ